MSWHEQRLKITVGLVSHRFQTQANVATFYIGLDVFSKARPIVFSADQFSCFIDTKMACQRVVVVSTGDLGSNNFRHER